MFLLFGSPYPQSSPRWTWCESTVELIVRFSNCEAWWRVEEVCEGRNVRWRCCVRWRTGACQSFENNRKLVIVVWLFLYTVCTRAQLSHFCLRRVFSYNGSIVATFTAQFQNKWWKFGITFFFLSMTEFPQWSAITVLLLAVVHFYTIIKLTICTIFIQMINDEPPPHSISLLWV